MDLFELNEAFASQSLAVIKELGIDAAKVRREGGVQPRLEEREGYSQG